MKNIFITVHCRSRFQERTPFKQVSEQNYNTQCALNKGYKLSSFRYGSGLYDYICSKQTCNGIYTVKVWNGFIYVFKNATGKTEYYVLCTVYPVPEEFLPVESFLTNKSNGESCYIEVGNGRFVSILYANGVCDDFSEALIFKSREKAMNFLKNNRNLDGLECNIVIL